MDGHRVPTIIRWTGHVEPNSVNTKLLSSLDWFPTFSFLAGFELSSSVVYDGVDISAALFSDAPSPRRRASTAAPPAIHGMMTMR